MSFRIFREHINRLREKFQLSMKEDFNGFSTSWDWQVIFLLNVSFCWKYIIISLIKERKQIYIFWCTVGQMKWQLWRGSSLLYLLWYFIFYYFLNVLKVLFQMFSKTDPVSVVMILVTKSFWQYLRMFIVILLWEEYSPDLQKFLEGDLPTKYSSNIIFSAILISGHPLNQLKYGLEKALDN